MHKTVFPKKHLGNRCFINRKSPNLWSKDEIQYIAEAHESTRQRIEAVTKRIHEEQIAGKDGIPYYITIQVHDGKISGN